MNVIQASQRFVVGTAIGITIPVALNVLQRIFCYATSSLCSPTPTAVLYVVGTASSLVYTVIAGRENLAKGYLLAKRRFQYNETLFQLAKSHFRMLLSEEMGTTWLKIHSFTLDEGLHHLEQICLVDKGICDGAVITFLHVLSSSSRRLSDWELERAITPINEIIYQAKREIKVDMRNFVEFSMFGPRFAGIDYDSYDPYHAFSTNLILQQNTSKDSFKRLLDKVAAIAEDKKNLLLAGRINFSGGEPLGHAIAFQCSRDQYRFRDLLIYSYPSLQELLTGLLQYSAGEDFHEYQVIEVRLWAFPGEK